ncbi:MAG: hypothetical protein Harvfovirus2_50 [Harvfovirus sp.]|uniref:Uncharacterized protein n=1 Tax=Harvfovirus sp. TaxID=2487768 RepID=A0A3G5A069_9VIRU|nr:MAG: hypothetical protein Harvfovirus2_50 [Harvfovirus sp.]
MYRCIQRIGFVARQIGSKTPVRAFGVSAGMKKFGIPIAAAATAVTVAAGIGFVHYQHTKEKPPALTINQKITIALNKPELDDFFELLRSLKENPEALDTEINRFGLYNILFHISKKDNVQLFLRFKQLLNATYLESYPRIDQLFFHIAIRTKATNIITTLLASFREKYEPLEINLYDIFSGLMKDEFMYLYNNKFLVSFPELGVFIAQIAEGEGDAIFASVDFKKLDIFRVIEALFLIDILDPRHRMMPHLKQRDGLFGKILDLYDLKTMDDFKKDKLRELIMTVSQDPEPLVAKLK